MAIPFFSIDISGKDIFNIIKNLIFPFYKENSKKNFRLLLSNYFPNKKILLLPSARLGFYLCLKKFFNKNDEIIFSAMSFPLYIKIANQLGLRVKLIDVSKKDLNIDLSKLKKQINNQTKGIVITHLFGYPSKIEKIKRLIKGKKIVLIEDCAQSFASKTCKNNQTGITGNVGIFSTSLIKIPTTFGGGILVTSDKKLFNYINLWLKHNLKFNFFNFLKLFIKNFISILNSFPIFYSVFSSKLFFFLNKYVPAFHRKIVYSGMSLNKKLFNPLERPQLSKYQIEFGISQLKKLDYMKQKRQFYFNLIKKKLINKNIEFLNYDQSIDWNYQYLIVKINQNYKMNIKKLYQEGIHVMEENVWDCTKYNYKLINNNRMINASKYNKKILRVPHTSFLNKKQIINIIDKLNLL